ncbi:ABC-type branched-subunit amino acid transport system ATPase component/branched-subunit amino acid ABC-type transport system permease component [Aeromicrobium panaciterrae]|uniref:ABC-type branched-subunit amino acid transport system ATPase component/branched-subunit amino acid ABC-type transport system permease component n=1 Tax=Aeromicrobium panaciterrae TaxID=363861 RepID=A0ABU1UMC3_9ACTN|nr:branched-chain amino acid ABC transporter permease/ATP-binding protein [Aeromicrobium panaciterrae]MDR7086320.1 ABC-type branched-subunit amino acid transport system ATPase component/branched-subunit amino acid ABC-type transport system permease component [Aeromicrobium panaciterrae]
MDQHILFLLFGLANGAIYAALALTLVVTYRSSGVINFSSGTLALLGAYTYAFLRRGEFLIPVPGFPKSVDLGTELGFVPAAAISVAICAFTGLLIYLLVFRPLRDVPPVGKAVASIGVMLVLSGMFTLRIGVDGVQTQPILPVDSWKVAGVNVTSDRVWFALIVVAIAAALAAAYRFTRFGLLTRAAANTEKGAYVSGIKPDRIAAANWMISGAVAALAGILISPILPLTPNSFTLLIVPALAAAVVAGFDRILPAVVAGIAIGMVQSDLTYLAGTWTWLPTSGRSELVVLLLILFVLVARAKPLPSRGLNLRASLGRAPRPQSIALPTLVSSVVGVAAIFLFSGDWLVALITSLIFAIISLSLVVVTGYAGQVSFAQLTLAGVAGFSLATLTDSWGVPFPLAPLIAAVVASVVGVIVGLPALRVRGLPVAIVTLATAVALEAFWFANSDFVGSSGKDVTGPTLFGLDLRSRVGLDYPRVQFGLLVLTVLVLVGVAVAKLRMSRLGSQMLAVRANERSAAGAGVAVVRVKLIAFAIGSFIAGLGGSMLAYFQGNVTFVSFSTFIGLTLFATAYLAGITSISGGVTAGLIGIGGMVPLILNKVGGLSGEWFAVIAGLGLILTLIGNPEGVVGPIHERLQKRRRDKAPITAASEPLDGDLIALEPVRGGEVVLEARNLGVRYGGVVAVSGVDLDVREGTIVGLIGPNGAGKTTLLDALSGFTPSTGTIKLDGTDLKGQAPHQRVRNALGRTFQHAELYEDLSVHENVIVGASAAHGRTARTVDETLELLGLAEVADLPVAELSQGRRQLVSIARALIGNPKVLMLDEPAGGLDSRESQWLGVRLRKIRDSGVTILLIDHDMHLVLNLCDDIYVLNFGEVIAHAIPSEIRADSRVAEAYLGSAHAEQEVVS